MVQRRRLAYFEHGKDGALTLKLVWRMRAKTKPTLLSAVQSVAVQSAAQIQVGTGLEGKWTEMWTISRQRADVLA
jgi:hypothetical protein